MPSLIDPSRQVADVKTPLVFAPLWESKARYKGAWGGRGSAKSWDRAANLIVRCVTGHTRAVCLREVQISLKDSVKQLLEDTIQRLKLGASFQVLESEIRGPNNSMIAFRGMKDANAENVKSLESFNIAWWEEAQTASQRSLDLLTPTMRADGAEMWFTWNPRKRTDPIDVLLRQNPPDDSIVIKANWNDNPYFPEALRADMERDRQTDPVRAAHIWDGAYEAQSDMQFISSELVTIARQRDPLATPMDPLLVGVDVARFGDDSSTIIIRRGRDCRTHQYLRFKGMDTMHLAAKVVEVIEQFRPDGVFVDEGGVGGGVVDRLRQLQHHVIGVNFGGKADYSPEGILVKNKRAEMWAKMREWLKGGAIPDEDIWDVDLTGPLYKYDENNAIVLEKKEDMKKRGLRSPDIADALALTFAYPVQPRGELERTADERPYDPFEWRR